MTGIENLFEYCKVEQLIEDDAEIEVTPWSKIFPMLDLNGNLLWFFEYAGTIRPRWAWDKTSWQRSTPGKRSQNQICISCVLQFNS